MRSLECSGWLQGFHGGLLEREHHSDGAFKSLGVTCMLSYFDISGIYGT